MNERLYWDCLHPGRSIFNWMSHFSAGSNDTTGGVAPNRHLYWTRATTLMVIGAQTSKRAPVCMTGLHLTCARSFMFSARCENQLGDVCFTCSSMHWMLVSLASADGMPVGKCERPRALDDGVWFLPLFISLLASLLLLSTWRNHCLTALFDGPTHICVRYLVWRQVFCKYICVCVFVDYYEDKGSMKIIPIFIMVISFGLFETGSCLNRWF